MCRSTHITIHKKRDIIRVVELSLASSPAQRQILTGFVHIKHIVVISGSNSLPVPQLKGKRQIGHLLYAVDGKLPALCL